MSYIYGLRDGIQFQSPTAPGTDCRFRMHPLLLSFLWLLKCSIKQWFEWVASLLTVWHATLPREMPHEGLPAITWKVPRDLTRSHPPEKLAHDDVIKWKHFPRYWLCEGNSSVTGEFPAQRPVTRSYDVFFDLYLNTQLSKTIVRLVIWDTIAPFMTSL